MLQVIYGVPHMAVHVLLLVQPCRAGRDFSRTPVACMFFNCNVAPRDLGVVALLTALPGVWVDTFVDDVFVEVFVAAASPGLPPGRTSSPSLQPIAALHIQPSPCSEDVPQVQLVSRQGVGRMLRSW